MALVGDELARSELSDLVAAARVGDESAWNQLVTRLAGLVWSITRGFGLSEHDALDVGQIVWLQLARNLDRIHEPERVGLWLATSTRRECVRLLQRERRWERVDPIAGLADRADSAPSTEDAVIAEERNHLLRSALTKLPTGCQALLRAFLCVPEPSYAEVAAALGMPQGSVGPRRKRCLQHLRVELRERLDD